MLCQQFYLDEKCFDCTCLSWSTPTQSRVSQTRHSCQGLDPIIKERNQNIHSLGGEIELETHLTLTGDLSKICRNIRAF